MALNEFIEDLKRRGAVNTGKLISDPLADVG